MIQGLDILKRLVAEEKLVENLSERELKNPENSGFDLRLGEVYKIKGNSFIGIEERKTPEAELVAKFQEGKKQSVIVKPQDYFLAKTVERVNVPEGLFGICFLRSTLWRCGIDLVSGMIGPGYSGELSIPIYNAGNSEVEIELGARIMHVFFLKIEGESSKYKGQWQGGRMSTEGIEKQV